MKTLFSLFCFLIIISIRCQDNYPVPVKNAEHLFYIQHSNSKNTFMYDANMDGKNISDKKPIETYRILYEEGGAIKPLTAMQNSMAYGINFKKISDNYFQFNLKGNKTLSLFLGLNTSQKPSVFLTINNKKMFLDKMYVQLKKGGIKPTADYILLTGKDFFTGKTITEKVEM
ncbi:DUF4833 domain-containing protein [Chryseobacterium sp. T1]